MANIHKHLLNDCGNSFMSKSLVYKITLKDL